jgi:hypothetical protein
MSDLFCIVSLGSPNDCVTAEAGGAAVSLAPCAFRADQQWRYDTRTRALISAASGRALDVARDGSVIQWRPHGRPNQQWELDAGCGAIRSCVGGCFLSAIGGRLRAEQPAGSVAQMWELRAAASAPAAPPARALFNIAIAGHPEFLLQPSAPAEGAAVCVSRPEATLEQAWAREPRGQDFVIRSAASGLVLGVHNGAVLLAPDAYAELWAMSRDGLIWSKRLSLFLDVGGPMAQKWAFWLVDDQ